VLAVPLFAVYPDAFASDGSRCSGASAGEFQRTGQRVRRVIYDRGQKKITVPSLLQVEPLWRGTAFGWAPCYRESLAARDDHFHATRLVIYQSRC
jgi:hypothetical protein